MSVADSVYLPNTKSKAEQYFSFINFFIFRLLRLA